MTHLNAKLILQSLATAATLTTVPLTNSATAAPDTIMLETIGAVRMAQPDEYQRAQSDERLTSNRSRDDHLLEHEANAR